MKKKVVRRMKHCMLMALSAVMALLLASCGGKKEAESAPVEQKEFVYVPEFINLGEDARFYSELAKGNSLYYMDGYYDEEAQTYLTIYKEYSLETKESRELPVRVAENSDVNQWTVDDNGNMYTVECTWGESAADGMSWENTQRLCKYDAQGTVAFEKDITEILGSDEENSWINYMLVDTQGRVYLASDNLIRLFDAQGEFQGEITHNAGWIEGFGSDSEGKVYISYYDSASANGGNVLTELDFEGKKLGQTYANFPSSHSSGALSAGLEKSFLVNDGSKVWEYDIASQSCEVLLDWLDCDINGTYVDYVGVMENGKLLAVIRDWNTGKTEMAYLTKTASSELPQKERIVVGTMYMSQSLQETAVNFNKQSDKYRVSIKNYVDQNNWTETSWQDAITALNNDIMSKNNCPDILDISSLNAEQLAAKEALEDLNPYLENSSALSREDFLESIVNGYTFAEKLVSIPKTFQLSSIAAKTSDVGAGMGWTVEDMMAYAQANPEASLFDYSTKESMLSTMLRYNQSTFIDWETGECRFDSEEFKQILAFANTLPLEYDYDEDAPSTPIKIQAGEILLEQVYMSDLNSIQEYEAMFNEPVTFIGYPNAEGTSGCYLSSSESYSIAAKSESKEGAWAFIEYYLTGESSEMFSWGFPSNKNALEEKIADATEVEYILDENGDPLLDENGEPIPSGGTSSVGYGDWEYTYHIPTEEEIARIKELMENAVLTFSADEQIMNIVIEEVEGYFQGQKTVDDVAAIIQSRVQVYVNENR